MNIVEFKGIGLKFFMDPVAFQIFSKEVYWYGIIIAIAFLTGFFVLMKFASKENYDKEVLTDIVIIATPVAIIGARLYYVAFRFDQYKNNLLDVFKIWEGGLAIYGAIIGAFVTTYIYCKYKKLNFFKIGDMAAPGIILAQSIGRWGNFVNGEAYGSQTDLPWAMTLVKNGVSMNVHPTFLYESISNLIIFIILLFFYKRKKNDGEVFLLYVGLYSFWRFFIEGLRTDSLYLGQFRISQIVAIFFVAFCVIVFGVVRKKVLYKKL